MPDGQEEQIENVAATHNFYDYPKKEKLDPFSNTYNPGWRNHPNFSYRNNQGQGQGGSHQQNFQNPSNFNKGKGIQGFQNPQDQQQQSLASLESLMIEIVSTQKQFMSNQQQTNDIMSNFIKELTTTVDEMMR